MLALRSNSAFMTARVGERWRPAFRGYQRMRIVILGNDPEYEIEAELDGVIATGFRSWQETDAFLVGIQEAQREPFL
jgi:hypothetical protein